MSGRRPWRRLVGALALCAPPLACEHHFTSEPRPATPAGERAATSGESANPSPKAGYLVAIDTPVRTYLDYVLLAPGEHWGVASNGLPQMALWDGATTVNAVRTQRFSPGQALGANEIVALLPRLGLAPQVLDVTAAPYRARPTPADATAAIQAALDDARAAARPGSPVDVVIPPGIFDHASVLDVGPDVRLRGQGGVLRSTDPAHSAVHLEGDRSGVLFLTLSSGASSRLTTDESSGIWVGPKAPSRAAVHDTVVVGNEIIQPASAHVLGIAEEGGLWAFNYAHDGYADSYHHTDGSSRCQVIGNRASGPGTRGDDLYAFVGYRNNGDPVHHCVCSGNWGRNGHARGLSAVGAAFVTFAHNDIERTQWAGIYIAQEAHYDTFGSFSIEVVGNRIAFANLVGSHAGLLAYADQPVGTRNSRSFGEIPNAVRDLTVRGNMFSNMGATRGGGLGIEVRSSCVGGEVSDNTVLGAKGPGVSVTGSGFTVSSNTVRVDGGAP